MKRSRASVSVRIVLLSSLTKTARSPISKSVGGSPPLVDGADIIDAARVAETFQILRTNYAAVGESLYAILLPKVQDRGLSKEQFLDGLSGEALDAGARAIEEEIVDFFPPRLRGMVGALRQKMLELAEAVVTKAEADVKAMSLSGMSSGPAPESSGSTPESGPSEN